MRIQTLLFLVAALVTLTPFSLPVGPQTVTGSLVGHVGDQSGAVVAGARVVATDIERGTSRETVTNDEGNYTISSMEPGNYRVEVERQGFGTFTVNSTEVAINTTVRVDAKLQVGGVAETVEVSGEPTLLKTDRGDISQQITHEQVEKGVKLDRDKLARYAELYKRLGSYPYDQDPLRPGWTPTIPNNRWTHPSDTRIQERILL